MPPRAPVWKTKRPAPPRVVLSPAAIERARARALAAGRRYPNLIDNMAVAREERAKLGRK